jgi:hypothetical protein
VLSLALTVLLTACGDDEDSATTAASTTTSTPVTTTTQTTPPDEDEKPNEDGNGEPSPDRPPTGPAEGPEGDPRMTALERAAARTARDYVSALDQRDGARVCALFAAEALDEVKLPRPKGGCAESMTASIGYEDPRGLPVWESSQLVDVLTVNLSGETAKVVATVVTGFADREEPSVEDDVIYLSREGDGWLIAKPSATLYRAVGIADVPPAVLTPP